MHLDSRSYFQQRFNSENLAFMRAKLVYIPTFALLICLTNQWKVKDIRNKVITDTLDFIRANSAIQNVW